MQHLEGSGTPVLYRGRTVLNPLAYTDVPETAGLARSGCETQFRDQPNITAQQGYVLKSIKINFASIKYKCT